MPLCHLETLTTQMSCAGKTEMPGKACHGLPSVISEGVAKARVLEPTSSILQGVGGRIMSGILSQGQEK